jgi:hypothetical protein
MCICSEKFSNISMYKYVFCAVHSPEDGHTSGRNMKAVYSVYNTLSYTCVHLLVLTSYFSYRMCTNIIRALIFECKIDERKHTSYWVCVTTAWRVLSFRLEKTACK